MRDVKAHPGPVVSIRHWGAETGGLPKPCSFPFTVPTISLKAQAFSSTFTEVSLHRLFTPLTTLVADNVTKQIRIRSKPEPRSQPSWAEELWTGAGPVGALTDL